MQTLRIAAVALTILSIGFHVASADDAMWRSSKPLRIRTVSNNSQLGSVATESVWDQIEYPLLVQRLQAEVDQVRANVEFWELRLENYEPLRFTDATQTAIRYAQKSLQASRRSQAEATRKLALVRRHRVALGALRAWMLQRGRVKSQLDR